MKNHNAGWGQFHAHLRVGGKFQTLSPEKCTHVHRHIHTHARKCTRMGTSRATGSSRGCWTLKQRLDAAQAGREGCWRNTALPVRLAAL